MENWNYLDRNKANRLNNIAIHALKMHGVNYGRFIPDRFLFEKPTVKYRGLQIAFTTSDFFGDKRVYFALIADD